VASEEEPPAEPEASEESEPPDSDSEDQKQN
jgi:hypothetical protein